MKRLLNPKLELPRLEVPRLGLAAFRQRILLRGVFVLLAVATAYRVPVALNASAVLACAVLVAVLSLLSGLGAMRSLLRADPATLLR